MPDTPPDQPQIRPYGPKTADHPSVGRPCPACHEPFAAGDMTTLVVYGPGGDPEARRKAAAGVAYTAVAAEVHWACATGEVTTPDGTAKPGGTP